MRHPPGRVTGLPGERSERTSATPARDVGTDRRCRYHDARSGWSLADDRPVCAFWAATIAGTATVTHIGTGLLGSTAYLRSGQLREPLTRRTAVILCGSALIGTPLGVLVNSAMTGRAFGIVLGVFVALVGALVWWREHRLVARANRPHPHHSTPILATLGLAIAAASGLLGIGGPMLTVPVLIACGVPVLSSIAAAQAQSSSSPASALLAISL